MASFLTGFHLGTMQNCNQTGCFQTHFGSFTIPNQKTIKFGSNFEAENFEIEVPK